MPQIFGWMWEIVLDPELFRKTILDDTESNRMGRIRPGLSRFIYHRIDNTNQWPGDPALIKDFQRALSGIQGQTLFIRGSKGAFRFF